MYKELRSLFQSIVPGNGAQYVENLSPNQIKKDSRHLLQRFLPGNRIPKPKNILVTDWNSNPYTLGSFSHQTVNSVISKVGPKNLQEPIEQDRILFAGEATHEKFFSTVHGAIESGLREAQRIICAVNRPLVTKIWRYIWKFYYSLCYVIKLQHFKGKNILKKSEENKLER